MTCDFCEFASDPGLLGGSLIQSTPWTLTFVPLRPFADGHVLVVPREHVTDLLDPAWLAPDRTFAAIRNMAHAVQKALAPEGMNLIQSSGAAAGQTVFHIHFHLIPRWNGDHIGDLWEKGRNRGVERDEEVAQRIRSAAQ